MNEPIAQFDFGKTIKTFRTESELAVWVKAERSAYQPILASTVNEQPVNLAKQLLANFLNAIDNYIAQYSGDQQAAITNLTNLANNLQNSYYIMSKSLDGKAIQRLILEHGEAAAAGAYCILSGHPSVNFGNMSGSAMKGALIALIQRNGISNKTASLMKSSMLDLDKEHVTTLKVREEEFSTLLSTLAIKMSQEINKQNKRQSKLVAVSKKSCRDQGSEAREAISSIKNTEQVYKEFMTTAAGKDYWEAKASGHETARKKNRNVVFWYAGIAGVISIGAYILAYIQMVKLADGGKIQLPQTILLASAVFLLSSILIWVARILVRNYLSEKHLAFDARERETMAIAYQAMIHNEMAGPEDRAIVLQALFRPTEDGIVDDAAPIYSPHGIVSSLLQNR